MSRFLKFYFCIALIVFIVNLFRYFRCLFYQAIYNTNFKMNTPAKNFNIKPSVIPLLRKGQVSLQSTDINIIANEHYKDEFNSAFETAKGYFKHYALSSPLWFFLAVDSLTIFTVVNKIGSKAIKIVFALFQFFVSYLVALYLDTSGIGNKILTFLLGSLTALSEHLAEHLH